MAIHTRVRARSSILGQVPAPTSAGLPERGRLLAFHGQQQARMGYLLCDPIPQACDEIPRRRVTIVTVGIRTLECTLGGACPIN